MREKNSLDLWFRWPQRRPLVIENKIFSLPHEKQLEGYATKAAARGEVPVFWLLSLSDPSWTDNRSGQCATTPTWSTCAPTWSPALS
jgi:hypothetical protein